MPLESSHKVQRKKNNCKFLKTEYEHSENIISALESIERISYRFTLRNRSLPCCSPEKEDRTEGGVGWGFEGGGGFQRQGSRTKQIEDHGYKNFVFLNHENMQVRFSF